MAAEITTSNRRPASATPLRLLQGTSAGSRARLHELLLRARPQDGVPRGAITSAGSARHRFTHRAANRPQVVERPDATALGQVFWYTLEGRDPNGRPTGGWDLDELRSIQDWYVRYALLAAEGVSEVASVGGFVREFQIDVDPDKMRYRNVRLEEVVDAVRRANVDVGARTIEVNRVEYVIRGLGFVKNPQHIEDALIKVVNEFLELRV